MSKTALFGKLPVVVVKKNPVVVPKIVPFGRAQIYFRVDQSVVSRIVHGDLSGYENPNVLALGGVFLLDALGELPDAVGFGGSEILLFTRKLFQGIRCQKACCFILHAELGIAVALAQHHPPAQAMAFFGPEHIAFDGKMAQGQQHLDNEIRKEKIQQQLLLPWQFYRKVGYRFAFEEQAPHRFRRIKEHDKTQREKRKNPDLQNNRIEDVEDDRTDKSHGPGAFPQKKRNHYKIEKHP